MNNWDKIKKALGIQPNTKINKEEKGNVMNSTWANRFQCTEFLDKQITDEQLNSVCNIINYIPEPPPGRGWNRVLWFLLDNSKSEHRNITEWLVENIHYSVQSKESLAAILPKEHFGAILQAPYVLHGAFLRLTERFPERSALSTNDPYEGQHNACTRAEFTIADLKQYENLMMHTGCIATKIIEEGLNCCFLATNKGRFLNFPKLITNEEEQTFTDMIKEVFPSVTDNPQNDWLDQTNWKWNIGIHEKDSICPAISIGFGHGVKHTDYSKVISHGKYKWLAAKDRKKLPNFFKS